MESLAWSWLLVLFFSQPVYGFSSSVSNSCQTGLQQRQQQHPPRATSESHSRLSATSSNEDDLHPQEHPNDDENNDDTSFHQQLKSRHEHLMVEKTRNALEKQHTQSFLKRRPVKLPYSQARQWVQANLGVDTKDEFDDLVANGNLRTPYIPKNPEEYYKSTGAWISWDHFLKGIFDDENPSAVRPRTGMFD
jgi:hypothetical protein